MNTESQESGGLLRRISRRLGHTGDTEVHTEREVRLAVNGNPSLSEAPSMANISVLIPAVLREALLAEASGRRRADTAVRNMMRHACDEARACGMPVEHLIILLKDALLALPESHHCTHMEARSVLGSTVTLCIDEYYRPRNSRAQPD